MWLLGWESIKYHNVVDSIIMVVDDVDVIILPITCVPVIERHAENQIASGLQHSVAANKPTNLNIITSFQPQ